MERNTIFVSKRLYQAMFHNPHGIELVRDTMPQWVFNLYCNDYWLMDIRHW